MAWHWPLLIAFSLRQRIQHVWGGCMLLPLRALRPDRLGILQVPAARGPHAPGAAAYAEARKQLLAAACRSAACAYTPRFISNVLLMHPSGLY